MRAFHSGGMTANSLTLIGMVAECNRLHKRMDAVYHAYAKQTGLSDAAFWLLYSLYERGAPGTQKDLCNLWFFSPQTPKQFDESTHHELARRAPRKALFC